MTTLAFYGSSLVSSYWNGAATYYRGIIKALAGLGWDVTFHEPDVWDRQKHRDIGAPDWCRVSVWQASPEGIARAAAASTTAGVVAIASGIGYGDDELREAVLAQARPDALRLWWDVDAPATLASLRADPGHPLRRRLPDFDLVLTYGGGDPVVRGYRALGARDCVPIYNALDPDTHFPVPAEPRFAADLGFLGNRLPDREARVGAFFLTPARLLPDRRFLMGGAGWDGAGLPPNVRALGHVGTGDHNAFNCTPKAVLNVSRADMAANGFSPATRVFEAAGAGACLITDAWEGIDRFLEPGREVLVARDGQDVADMLAALTPEHAESIGAAARRRVLSAHCYSHRAGELAALLAARVHEAAL